MQRVTIVPDAQDQSSWKTYEVEDIRSFLRETLIECSSDATIRIYHGDVAQVCDVTPATDGEFEHLGSLPGPFFIITYPGDPITIIIIAVVVVAAVAMMMLVPPLPTLRSTNSESPNNELSARTNKARPMARIPDIFGQVWSTPDLLAVPYSKFEDHKEVEYAYMCIGRGPYAVAASGSTYDVRDDTTLINDIGGTSCEIYAPDTSPNSGDEPEIRIGGAIGEEVWNVKRFTAVNGQELRAPNDESVSGNSDIWFADPNEIHCETDSGIDFTEFFQSGDDLTISNAHDYASYVTEPHSITVDSDGSFSFSIPSGAVPAPWADGLPVTLEGAVFPITDDVLDLDGDYRIDSVSVVGTGPWELKVVLVSPESVNSAWDEVTEELGPVDVDATLPDGAKSYDLDGVYEASTVSARVISLVDPVSVNADWGLLSGMVDDKTASVSPTISVSGLKWIGPFTLDVDDMVGVMCNFIAQNGLYKDNGENQYPIRVRVRIELTPVDAAGDPTGAAETFGKTVVGSATTKTMRAATRYCNPTFTGLCEVRVARLTEKMRMEQGQAVEEVKWRDVYTFSPTGKTDFGDVTTIQMKTYATTGATAIKERKTRALVTRKLPSRVTGSTFTTALTATTSAADIISAACLDEWIGRRVAAEIDFDSIYDTYDDVVAYFGSDIAGQFNYTFDSDNLSFEETISSMAAAIFSVAYRRGNVIKLSAEMATEDSTLLFNHRNKLPGTETRTQSFGYMKDHDGVEYQWVDPKDDAIVTKYLPSNRNSRNPKKIESVGIRNGLQAYLHAWRVWNRIRYQNLVTEFDACSEGALCILNDRILVADNTRTGTQDGEVLEQDVLTLTLSQPVTFEDGVNYTIFLQLSDCTVESISITAGATETEVVLSQAPSIPLVIDPEMFARTGYIIVGDDDTREKAFLVSEKGGIDNRMIVPLQAVNYDSRYYEHDTDYIDGIVDEEGNLI